VSIEFLHLLLFIIIANAAPILIRVLLNDYLNLAVDFGSKLSDNNRLFGAAKTWRGIFAALGAASMATWLFDYSWETGFLIAIYAIVGDLLSSFIKRRLAMAASSSVPFLDQVPESFFPAFMMMHAFYLEISSVLLLVLVFTIIDMVMTYALYHWRVLRRAG